MIEYLKTAGQTAKKNGCTLINNKLIADFSAVKKFLDDSATELDKIGLTVEEVFKGFKEAAAEEILKSGFVSSEFLMVDFWVNDYHIYTDFISLQKAVYVDDMRKYGIVQPIAARVNAYYSGCRESALGLVFNEYLYKRGGSVPIQEICR